MKQRRTFLVALVATTMTMTMAACDSGKQRDLLLVDGSGPTGAGWVGTKVAEFERRYARGVRTLAVASAGDALQLAARGEADVALVPESTSIDAFVAAEHGREVGRVASVRILEVSARQHPKVDGEGARALAAFLAEP